LFFIGAEHLNICRNINTLKFSGAEHRNILLIDVCRMYISVRCTLIRIQFFFLQIFCCDAAGERDVVVL